jgi:hypothetical protein
MEISEMTFVEKAEAFLKELNSLEEKYGVDLFVDVDFTAGEMQVYIEDKNYFESKLSTTVISTPKGWELMR